MKKIMVIAAVALTAVCVNAAQWTWKVQGTIYEAGSSSPITSGTAYLFDAGVVTQTALLQAFFDDGVDVATKAVSGAPSIAITSAGKGAGTSAAFDYSNADAKDYYVAVVSGDDICLVNSKNTTGSDTGGTLISPNSFSTPSKNAAIEWKSGDSYSAAGWYTSVPEPTSGLLLLMGGALLALRRKRK